MLSPPSAVYRALNVIVRRSFATNRWKICPLLQIPADVRGTWDLGLLLSSTNEIDIRARIVLVPTNIGVTWYDIISTNAGHLGDSSVLTARIIFVNVPTCGRIYAHFIRNTNFIASISPQMQDSTTRSIEPISSQILLSSFQPIVRSISLSFSLAFDVISSRVVLSRLDTSRFVSSYLVSSHLI